MTEFERFGPWTGAALTPKPPYSVRRRKARAIRAFIAGAALATIYLIAHLPAIYTAITGTQ